MTYAQLIKTSTGWAVRYQSGPRADVIRQLFGTNTLPLPYTLELSLKEAVAEFVGKTRGARAVNAEGGVVLR